MQHQRRRWGVLAVLAAAMVPLAIAATAFACARLATLKVHRAGGPPGTTVEATGRNFNSNPASSTVKIRWNSRNGDVLWEGRPDSRGKFTADFTVPDARPGYYVVLATQALASGAPAAGTPGRHSFKVRRAKASRDAVGAVPVGGSTGGGPSVPGVLGLSLALLAVSGAAAWSVSTVRRSRRRAVSVLGRAS